MSKKQSCLNCYYCMRDRSYEMDGKEEHILMTLSLYQRESIRRAGDFTFLKEENKAFNRWQREHDRLKGKDMPEEFFERKFPKAPVVPVKNNLVCATNHWTKDEQAEKTRNREFLMVKTCAAFFNVSGNEDLKFEDAKLKHEQYNKEKKSKIIKNTVFVFILLLFAAAAVLLLPLKQ